MLSILALGFLIGMQHALEADHVAAVASLAGEERSLRRMVRHGAVWGFGHALTLCAFAGAVLLLGAALPVGLAETLEAAVGGLLILLGGWVLLRLVRDRVHFHAHRHGDGTVHVHAHSHAGDRRPHEPAHHQHAHPSGLPVRTFLVGMTHGLAGSAAILVLTAASVGAIPLGLLYIAVFGAGSIVGMAALSAVIAIPLGYSARLFTWGNRALRGAIGAATVGLGVLILYEHGSALWA